MYTLQGAFAATAKAPDPQLADGSIVVIIIVVVTVVIITATPVVITVIVPVVIPVIVTIPTVVIPVIITATAVIIVVIPTTTVIAIIIVIAPAAAIVIVIVIVIIETVIDDEITIAGTHLQAGAGIVVSINPFNFLLEDVAGGSVIDHFELLCAADRLDLDLAQTIVDLDALEALVGEIIDDLVSCGLGKCHRACEGCDNCGQECLLHGFSPFMFGSCWVICHDADEPNLTASVAERHLQMV